MSEVGVESDSVFNDSMDSIESIVDARVVRFLDFAVMQTALPWSPGHGPYEPFVFQYGIRKLLLDERDEVRAYGKAGWILDGGGNEASAEQSDLEFVVSLQRHLAIGDVSARPGAIWTYSPHTRTMLTRTRQRIGESTHAEAESCLSFLDSLLGGSHDRSIREERLDDMYHIVLETVSHPSLGGSYSLENLLPIALQSAVGKVAFRHLMPDLAASCRPGESPYDVLGRLAECGMAVRDDLSAMRAYGAIRGEPGSRRAAEAFEELRRYSELNTAALVVVWSWLRKHII